MDNKKLFLDALNESDQLANTAALLGLAKYGDDEAADAVLAFMQNSAISLKQKAAVALGKLGVKGKTALEEILRGSDSELITFALIGYEFVSDPDKELVKRHLWSGDPKVVQSAILAFGRCWPDEIIETLSPLFGHVHDGVRCHVLPYVFVETEKAEAINYLTHVYRQAGEHLREHILDSLKRGIRRNPELMQKTISIPAMLLADEREDHNETMEELRKMLQSESELVRWKAAHEVVMKPVDAAHDLLLEMFASEDPIVARRALAYILDCNPNPFLEQIIGLLSHTSSDVRIRALAGLLRINIEERHLLDLLNKKPFQKCDKA